MPLRYNIFTTKDYAERLSATSFYILCAFSFMHINEIEM